MTNHSIPTKDTKIGFELLALFSAFLWGSSFVAQKSAMFVLPPLTFTSLRFIAALPILLLMVWLLDRHKSKTSWRQALFYAGPPGIALACASGLQQVGLVTSSATKAGFIISLYVCITPFLAILSGYRLRFIEVSAALLAISGIYLLVVIDWTVIEIGDLLLLASAFAWAVHIISIDRAVRHVQPMTLTTFHVGYCIIFTGLLAIVFEPPSWHAVPSAAWQLLYAGPLAAGIALGLQIISQEHLSPNRVSLLVCTAVFFAALGGWILLGETLSIKEWIGGMLMIAALLIVRIR